MSPPRERRPARASPGAASTAATRSAPTSPRASRTRALTASASLRWPRVVTTGMRLRSTSPRPARMRAAPRAACPARTTASFTAVALTARAASTRRSRGKTTSAGALTRGGVGPGVPMPLAVQRRLTQLRVGASLHWHTCIFVAGGRSTRSSEEAADSDASGIAL